MNLGKGDKADRYLGPVPVHHPQELVETFVLPAPPTIDLSAMHRTSRKPPPHINLAAASMSFCYLLYIEGH